MVFRGRYGFDREPFKTDNTYREMRSEVNIEKLERFTLYNGTKTVGRVLREHLDNERLSKGEVISLLGDLPSQKRMALTKFLKLQE